MPNNPNTANGPIWTTGDGKQLTPLEMTTLHIENAKAFLESKLPKLTERVSNCLYSYPSFPGEMAQDHAEMEWDRNINKASMQLGATRNWIKVFGQELQRREALAVKTKTKGRLSKDSLAGIHEDLLALAKIAYMNHSTRKWIFSIAGRIEKIIGK